MARYYRRRYTRVVAKPKRKWASNVVQVANDQFTGFLYQKELVANKAQANAPTPTIIKTGNFKVSLDVAINTAATSLTQSPVLIAYIIYVPEGWPALTFENVNTLINSHPEWIMATKVMGGSWGSGTTLSAETLNLSSRLKRNLNSGDKVLLLITSNLELSSSQVSGIIRYWTCAN